MLIALIILALILSAFFSGSEIAFVSANKLRVELKKKKGSARGRILAGFFEDPSTFLGTMLVGNNIVLVVFTTLLTKVLEPIFLEVAVFQEPLVLLITQTIIATIIILIFGEFLPKTLFRLYADEVIYFFAYPLNAFKWLLTPFSWVMTRLSNSLLRTFSLPVEESESAFTRLDLENFIYETRADGQEELVDKELFGKALNLREVRVRECMVPRTEVENIDVNASIEELERLFKETKLSRIIVTKDDIDNVLGYVHHQQLFTQPRSISQLIIELPFVPEVVRVVDLLNDFIRERINIAVVVDEYGGLSGLITLEDILEEIFGEIEDEHDEEEYVEEVVIPNQEYVFSGRLEIDYLNEKYNLSLPEGDYHTLSGYLVMTTEAIPEQGGTIELDQYAFILEMVSDTKIETVRIIRREET
jgi:putative hemolysin